MTNISLYCLLLKQVKEAPNSISWSIAFLIHKRYIPDPEQLNQQRFKCAAQMRELLYLEILCYFILSFFIFFNPQKLIMQGAMAKNAGKYIFKRMLLA